MTQIIAKPPIAPPTNKPNGLITTSPKMPFAQAATTGPAPTAAPTAAPSPVPAAVPGTAKAEAYTTAPKEWENTRDQTTAGQLDDIIRDDSPLMQQAKTNAMQQMNTRGLLNSSMAVGAGQGAVIEKALPIASADAQQAARVAGYNADQTNQTQAAFDQARTQVSGLNATEANKMLMQHLDNTSKVDLMNLEANYKNLMQTNASASELYKQAQVNMTNILSSNTMSAEAKQIAIRNQLTLLKAGMDIQSSISGLDLSGILDFSNLPGSTIADDMPKPPVPRNQTVKQPRRDSPFDKNSGE